MRKAFKVLVFVLIACLVIMGSGIILKEKVFPTKYSNYVAEYSKKYDVNPMLVFAIMKAESNFNENAKSKKDARGLMQITGDTGTWIAEQIGVKDFNVDMLNEPEVSIEFACWYLNNLSSEFDSEDLVIAAYNAGRGNVQKWLASEQHSKDGQSLDYIPFKETDKYVKKVNTYKNIYTALYGRK